MTEWMNLREERDFGEKFNATFLFVRQNFKNLSLSLLLLGAPLMIVANLLDAYSKTIMQTGSSDYTIVSPDGLWSNYITIVVVYLILILVYLIAYSWILTVTYAYIAEYLTGNREITTSQVFRMAIRKIGKILVSNIILFIMVGLGFLLVIIPGIYLIVAATFVQVIIIVEEVPVFKSISRSISLIKGKWWSTFGLIVVMSFVAVLMQLVFAIPALVNLFVNVLHQNFFTFDAWTILSGALTAIGATLLYPLILIAIAFQYFNMVERHESKGLMNEIDMAGKQTETTPKNEGEY